ncbi:MAG: FtsQ-type POTRA domain-containing protein [Lachnospiraceae bacterium]|nr:FtsQ-type POTRA domain-containing protein [Lachnospiraceae bacterium]
MKKRKGKLRVFIVVLTILLVFAGIGLGGYLYITKNYTVNNVIIEGNVHYTDEQIIDLVMTGRFGHNSIYLSYKYKNREIKDVPFVDTITVTILSPDSVRISVYEKALAGFIEYLGRYIYFDRDGTVVESSTVKTQGVPEVVGVDFDYVVLYDKLPAQDPKLFNKVLNLTKLMSKYSVDAEKIYFNKNGDIVLYLGSIVINLGREENLDIKIMNLPSILKKLDGMSGTLRMENYDENTDRVSFEPSRTQETQ